MSGPLPRWLRPLAGPASWFYGRAVARRNARFDAAGGGGGGDGVVRLDRPVISIGNITTGGTGKTPMVHWIATKMLRNGVEPAIAMRGYGAGRGAEGDEAAIYRQFLPDVLLVVGADRAAGLQRELPRHPQVKVVLLDDGFQHRRLHRDLDLALIDASRTTFADRLLPAGNLREPVENLTRADAIIITRARDQDQNLSALVEKYHGRAPIAWCRHVWVQLWVCRNHPRLDPEPVEWLRGKRVVTLLGVGNPGAVRDELGRVGAVLHADVPASDHERFSPAKLRQARSACSGADALLVTYKDWVRLRDMDLPNWPVPVVVPQVEIDVFEGEQQLVERLIQVVSSA